ncbi:DUF4129 domain-containing protein, partial [Micromonospora sp. B11E3]|uniref:DUF4129 domain-containing protein n=1 Tax=Micromonospora sp. B11E3 TaxID=3153562 RepID=UPI00325DEBF1
MSASRWWTEAVAALGDLVPLPLATLLLLLAAGLVALGWYHFPAWVPRRLPRLPRLRRPRLARLRLPRPRWPRRRRRGGPALAGPESTPTGPAPPADAGPLADRLAAQGRYAEAVRERLRGMIGELVAERVVEQRPGMTVAELTAAATAGRPPVGPPLTGAAAIFSEIWYAHRPASPAHDARMRELAEALHHALTLPPTPTPP